jgi:hypothetical protein
MTRKQVRTGLLGIAALAAVMIGTVAAFDDSPPGRSADPELLASIRARAFGPCNTVGSINCQANLPQSIVCSPTDVACDAQAGRGCGTCTGPLHITCKSTNKTPCTEAIKKCCNSGKKCQTNATGCHCITSATAPKIGTWIDCT